MEHEDKKRILKKQRIQDLWDNNECLIYKYWKPRKWRGREQDRRNTGRVHGWEISKNKKRHQTTDQDDQRIPSRTNTEEKKPKDFWNQR